MIPTSVSSSSGPRRTPSPRHTLLIAAFSNMLSPLPVFLMGSLSVFIRRELDLTESQFGLAVSAFFAASAVGSVLGGRIGERVGAFRAIVLASGVAAVAMTGVAVLARTLSVMAVCLAVAGIANAVAQPATNLAIARRISVPRQGLAFGIKQSTGPGAALVAGMAVPAVGLTVGWRWAFAGTAVICALFALITRLVGGTRDSRPRSAATVSVGTRPLVALTLTTAFGAASLNSVAAFYVDSAVAQHGMGEGRAGVWLAIGGVCGMVGRIAAGWFADRLQRRQMVLVAGLLAAGGAGVSLLSVAGSPGLRALATILGFAAGWGWSGVFNFIMVRQNDLAPAAATSITNTGLFLGGMTGPPIFGFLVQHVSYVAAWAVAGAWMATAAGLVLLARRLLLHERLPRTAEP